MRYCIFCGVRIPPEAKFCQMCGQEQPELAAGETAAVPEAAESQADVPAATTLTSRILSQSPLKLIVIGAGGFLLIIAILTIVVIMALGK